MIIVPKKSTKDEATPKNDINFAPVLTNLTPKEFQESIVTNLKKSIDDGQITVNEVKPTFDIVEAPFNIDNSNNNNNNDDDGVDDGSSTDNNNINDGDDGVDDGSNINNNNPKDVVDNDYDNKHEDKTNWVLIILLIAVPAALALIITALILLRRRRSSDVKPPSENTASQSIEIPSSVAAQGGEDKRAPELEL